MHSKIKYRCSLNSSGSVNNLPANYSLGAGAMLANAMTLAGSNVPIYAPVTISSNGGGSWSFSSQLSVPAELTLQGSYVVPVISSSTVMIEYNDGNGHTGVLVGNTTKP